MESYASVLTIAVGFFVVLITVELGLSFVLKKKVYRVMDSVSSLSSGMTNTMKDILKLSVVVISYEWMVSHWALLYLDENVWVYVLAFVGIDFASYWSHRWNHEFNLFWNRHIIHHSSEEFNLAAALRQPISGIIGIYFFLYIPMALMGIPAKVVAVLAPLHLFAQFWYHTRLINKMGILEHIIVTPSHHRVHHAINKEYIDKNYAAIFILWDKWFGTFQEELPDVRAVYGVKKAVKTWNPVLINFMHLWQLIKDAWRTQKYWDKARIWFMPTGWRPADVLKQYPIDYTEDAYTQVKYETPSSRGLKVWIIFQMLVHLLFQFHLISLLPELPYFDLLLYGIFIVVSIFSYTTLMDRHWLAPYIEAFKVFFGFALLYYFQAWFNMDTLLPFPTILMSFYLVASIFVAWYYTVSQSATLSTVELN